MTIKAYNLNEEEGIGAFRAVSQSPNVSGECRLPPAIGSPILGLTLHSQAVKGAPVSVVKAGIVKAVAANQVEQGDAMVATKSGKLISLRLLKAGRKYDCVGFAETGASEDGDVFEVFISMHQRTRI